MECDVFRDRLHKNLTPSIVSGLTSTIFHSFAKIINLLYVIQFKDVKKAFKKIMMSTTTVTTSEAKFMT